VRDITSIIDAYFALLNEPDPTRRAALLSRVWAPDGRWVDPPLASEGPTGIDAMIVAAQGQFPGHRFRRVSGIDQHHDHFRFGWELVAPDGSVVVAGTDIGELTPDGRLRRIIGFFGPLPALAPA